MKGQDVLTSQAIKHVEFGLMTMWFEVMKESNCKAVPS